MLLAMIMAPLILALFVAVIPTTLRQYGWGLAAIPAVLFALLALRIPAVATGTVFRERTPWLSSIGLDLSFTLDGLSLLFGLLITGIGTLIVLYAAEYLSAEKRAFQFQSFLLLFMGAMLGLVLADNMLALFVFWELTSVTSFLLVGFMYRAPQARSAARMALTVTGLGGLALLGGLVLLGQIVGSYELSVVLGAASLIQASPLYPFALALVLLGAFTKSAQFPFHFWLPNAMAAPTPASAYLHSATMVKAGIYLMARLSPALGGNDLWTYTLVGFGLGTLVLGSGAAMVQSDLKALLAYTTLAQLGAFTALIGIGADGAKALTVGILSHALYKAPLFMASGNVQHATHTRDIGKLGALARLMPLTCAVVWVASFSMAGLPPLMGFLGKEKLIEAFFEHGHHVELPWLTALTVGAVALAGLLTVAVSLRLIWDTFMRPRERAYEHEPHEAAPLMLLGPLLLAALSLALVFVPGVGALLGQAAAAVSGKAEPVPLAGALWTGVNPTLLTSLAAIGLGLVLFALRGRAIPALQRLNTRYSGGFVFEQVYDGLMELAYLVGRPIEALRLRQSVLLVFLAVIALVGGGLLRWTGVPVAPFAWQNIYFYQVVIVLLIPLSALATVLAGTRLKAIAALGIVGAMVALIFAIFSAPDLALTQLLVETLSLVFILIAFARLPRKLIERASSLHRARDVAIAVLVGLVMGCLTLVALAPWGFESIASYHVANSKPLANGDNVVNVILVDFRGFDTLGEITVLATAALGVFAVLHSGRKARTEQDQEPEVLDGVFSDDGVLAQELVDSQITTPVGE